MPVRIAVRYGNFGRERVAAIPVNLDERNDAIRAMARNGLAARVIASRMGMTVDRVRQIGRGLFRGPIGRHGERDAEIARAVQGGRTLREVARAYGLTPQRVHQIVQLSCRASHDPH